MPGFHGQRTCGLGAISEVSWDNVGKIVTEYEQQRESRMTFKNMPILFNEHMGQRNDRAILTCLSVCYFLDIPLHAQKFSSN
jgi:hypothetical protein